MVDAQPNLHRRRLGAALRQLRREAGLSLNEAATAVGLSAPAVSRVENGKQRVLASAIAVYMSGYGIEDEKRAADLRALASLANQNKRSGLVVKFPDSLPGTFAEFVQLEEMAVKAEISSGSLVPGLLQTDEYAAAIIGNAIGWRTEREVRAFIDLRMERQRCLTKKNPLALWCVLDEAALRREVGGPDVMRRQMLKLIEAAEELPNLTLQVMPFSHGVHPGLDGPFTTFHFSAGPPVVILESNTTTTYLEEDRFLDRYEMIFDNLRSDALGRTPSLDFISRVAKGA